MFDVYPDEENFLPFYPSPFEYIVSLVPDRNSKNNLDQIIEYEDTGIEYRNAAKVFHINLAGTHPELISGKCQKKAMFICCNMIIKQANGRILNLLLAFLIYQNLVTYGKFP